MGPKANALFRQVTAHPSTRKPSPRSIAFSNSTPSPIEPNHNNLLLKTLLIVPASRSMEMLRPGVAEIERLMRVIRGIGELLVLLAAIIAAAWAFGAVWFDAPFGHANKIAATLMAIALAAVLLFVRPFLRKLGIFVVLFAGVLIWWLTL